MAWKGLGLDTLAPVAMLALAIAVLSGPRSSAEEARAIPGPALDEPATSNAGTEVAILAGGCFWGVQGVFQQPTTRPSSTAKGPIPGPNTARRSFRPTPNRRRSPRPTLPSSRGRMCSRRRS